jgi:hypothetical protein
MHVDFPAPRIAGEVAQLLDATLRDEPPVARPALRPADRRRLRLGGYLLTYGYLTPGQLMRILAAQRRPVDGRPLLLGDLVVGLNYASARVVTTMLIVQLMDQLASRPARPDRLGERLVFAGLLRPTQLATALQLQLALRGSGQAALLGDLLVQHRLVPAKHVERMLLAAAEADQPLDASLAQLRLGLSQGDVAPARFTLIDAEPGPGPTGELHYPGFSILRGLGFDAGPQQQDPAGR